MQQNKEQQQIQPKKPQHQISVDDLKTPSFIPIECEKPSTIETTAEQSSAPPDIPNYSNLEISQNETTIEPDSLDPNINNGDAAHTNGDKDQSETPPEVSAVAGPSEPVTADGQEVESAEPSTSAVNNNKKNKNGSKKPRSRHRQKRYTHSEKRYHSEVRQEAVQQALAQMNKSKPVPMPSKRSSVMKNSTTNEDGDSDEEEEDDDSTGQSGSEDDEAHPSANQSAAEPRIEPIVTNVTLVSDTSSNNSLARNNINLASLVSTPTVASTPLSATETPPLPSRNTVSQQPPPPTRPPVMTSPSRQNSR